MHGDPFVSVDGYSRTRKIAVWNRPSDYGRADAEFIAAARSDVPVLLAEVERLRALVAARDTDETTLRTHIAEQIEQLRERHFQQYGNEENGPRNYDWALTHAADLVARRGIFAEGAGS
jgi:hypothetical protein